jgi:hypothetical protein
MAGRSRVGFFEVFEWMEGYFLAGSKAREEVALETCRCLAGFWDASVALETLDWSIGQLDFTTTQLSPSSSLMPSLRIEQSCY